LSLIAFCALFATIGSGCVSTGSDEFSKPMASKPGGSDPVVLNGAGGKVSNPATMSTKADPAASAATRPVGAVAQPAVSDSGAPAPGGPLFGATPVAPLPQTPAVAAAPPDPSGQSNLVKNADGFPNVNSTPMEPSSKLLPEDERARVIAELEALRKKDDSASKAPAGTQVAKKSGTKVKPAKCPDGTTATTVSGCKQ
jgi:hypothetical protein